MSRYYFNLFNDHETVDEEGADFPDDNAACQWARIEARCQAAESIKEHGHLVLSHRIVIQNAEKQEIAIVTFGDAVDVRS